MNQLKTFLPFCIIVNMLLFCQMAIGQNSSIPGAKSLGRSVNLLEGEAKPGKKMLLQELVISEIFQEDEVELNASVREANTSTQAEDKFNLEIGIESEYGAFSAKAEMNLSKSVRESTETKIVIITKNLVGSTVEIKDKQHLKLEPEFMKDLKNPYYSPEKLFKYYGTHITLGVKIGGQVMGIYTSRENTVEQNSSLRVAAVASFSGTTGSTEFNQAQSNSRREEDIMKKWIIRGGDRGSVAALDQNKNEENYTNWAKSTKENPAFTNFTNLKPIWELDDINPKRKSELEKAFKLLHVVKSLENLEIFNSNNETRSEHPKHTLVVPKGYKILSGGAKITSDIGGFGILLYASYPQSGSSWQGSGKAHHKLDYGTIEVYTIAVYDPFDLLDVKIASYKSAKLKKPSVYVYNDNSYQLVGGGAKVNYSGYGNLLTGSYPNLKTKSWYAASGDCVKDDFAELISYAIGIKFKDDGIYKIICKEFIDSSVTGGANNYSISVANGYQLVGGGAVTYKDDLNKYNSANYLTASYPSSESSWAASSKAHFDPSSAKLFVMAIGLKVEKDERFVAKEKEDARLAAQAKVAEDARLATEALAAQAKVAEDARLEEEFAQVTVIADPVDDGVLISGQVLNPGEKIVSENGVYYLKMQKDGNLCLKKTAGNEFVWCFSDGISSKLTRGTVCKMQEDGNLKLSVDGQFVWSAFSQSSQLTNGSYLKLTNEGEIQIITPNLYVHKNN